MNLKLPAVALAAHLERVLAGHAELEQVFEAHSRYGAALKACFHGLQHFAADHDLRESESEYRQMQEAEMRKLIELLRSGASEHDLRKVHFLGHSRR